jgi:methionyl aminopeptidase
MRDAGKIVAETLLEVEESAQSGVSTRELDLIGEEAIRSRGAEPAFPYINDFPGNLCISINNEVVHGIPGPRRLRDGDLVKIDAGAIYQGYHGDAAITVRVGSVSDEADRLTHVTEEALALGIDAVAPAGYLHDIGTAIQTYVETQGFSVVRLYAGHGIGRELHEDPSVPHYRPSSRGPLLRPGMVFTIEPMINAGSFETETLDDGWTVVTKDGRLSAQFEHTVAVTESGREVLSVPSSHLGWALRLEGAGSIQ